MPNFESPGVNEVEARRNKRREVFLAGATMLALTPTAEAATETSGASDISIEINSVDAEVLSHEDVLNRVSDIIKEGDRARDEAYAQMENSSEMIQNLIAEYYELGFEEGDRQSEIDAQLGKLITEFISQGSIIADSYETLQSQVQQAVVEVGITEINPQVLAELDPFLQDLLTIASEGLESAKTDAEDAGKLSTKILALASMAVNPEVNRFQELKALNERL